MINIIRNIVFNLRMKNKGSISIYRYIPPCCDTDPQIYAVPTNFNP